MTTRISIDTPKRAEGRTWLGTEESGDEEERFSHHVQYSVRLAQFICANFRGLVAFPPSTRRLGRFPPLLAAPRSGRAHRRSLFLAKPLKKIGGKIQSTARDGFPRAAAAR